jgi:mannose-1-phosphate guanylyltransferase
MGWWKPTPPGNVTRFLEKPNPDEITTNNINAGIYVLEPTPSTGFRRTCPGRFERSYFPSLIERGETFVAYV